MYACVCESDCVHACVHVCVNKCESVFDIRLSSSIFLQINIEDLSYLCEYVYVSVRVFGHKCRFP